MSLRLKRETRGHACVGETLYWDDEPIAQTLGRAMTAREALGALGNHSLGIGVHLEGFPTDDEHAPRLDELRGSADA
jgi:hypothetical protein